MTTLADIVIPEEYAMYSIERTAERSALLSSMAVRTDPTFQTFLNGGGQTVNVPFWNPLDQNESNVSDTSATTAALDNITANRQEAVRHNRNRLWTSFDLSSQLAGDDPIDAIMDQQADYWGLDIQSTLINGLNGVIADNVANDGGDMVNDIYGDVASPTDANLVSAEAIIDTMQTMGDSQQDIALIVCHSVVMTRLNKLNLIDFIPDWRGEINQPTYLGKPVIVNDQLSVIAGSNTPQYTTYLMGAGSVAWSETPARRPFMVDRDERAGNGGGQEWLAARRQYICHPVGFRWLSASMAGPSPTNAEYATAANWDRVFPERKQVKMAFLQSNG